MNALMNLIAALESRYNDLMAVVNSDEGRASDRHDMHVRADVCHFAANLAREFLQNEQEENHK